MVYFSLVKLFEYFPFNGSLIFYVWCFGNLLHSMSFTVETIMKLGSNPRKLLLFFIKFGAILYIRGTRCQSKHRMGQSRKKRRYFMRALFVSRRSIAAPVEYSRCNNEGMSVSSHYAAENCWRSHSKGPKRNFREKHIHEDVHSVHVDALRMQVSSLVDRRASLFISKIPPRNNGSVVPTIHPRTSPSLWHTQTLQKSASRWPTSTRRERRGYCIPH